MNRTREDFDGSEKRDPKNRWSRRLEEDLGNVKEEIEQIKEQLRDGKGVMGTLKLGQQLIMTELTKNTNTCAEIKKDLDSFPQFWRDLLGAKRIAQWGVAIIIALSAAIMTTINVVERYYKLNPQVQVVVPPPATGQTR